MGASTGAQHGQQKSSLLQDPSVSLRYPNTPTQLSAEVRTLLSACSSSHWGSRVPETVCTPTLTPNREVPLAFPPRSLPTQGRFTPLSDLTSAWVLPASAFAPTLFHGLLPHLSPPPTFVSSSSIICFLHPPDSLGTEVCSGPPWLSSSGGWCSHQRRHPGLCGSAARAALQDLSWPCC